jgi:hypothetical protein
MALLAEMAELDSEDTTARWGIASIKPKGDYTLVVALQRHVYVEPARQICEKVSPGMMYWMEAHRVRNNEAAGLVHASPRRLCSWWQEPDRVLGVPEELLGDEQPMYSEQTAGALKIISGCGYDPGSAAFRLHSAINEETKHAMAFVRWGDNNPHCSLRQLDAQKDSWALRDAVEQADVLHNHVAYWLLNNTGLAQQSHQLLIRHYHGSRRNGLTNLEPMFDKAKNALLLGARLQLVAEAASFGLSMEWSPIPMPVRRYEALRDRVRQQEDWVPLKGVATKARPFVVAHTPTNMAIKGTDVFRRVMSSLRARGVPVVMRLIHGVSLGEALSRQATSDAMFDSFWLGIQGSGLQAGAMEMPVIAGDADNRVLYEAQIGSCPYTFADCEDELAAQIERLAMDPAYRESEAQRTAAYTRAYHDYAAVARRYEETLARAMNRTDIFTIPMPKAS